MADLGWPWLGRAYRATWTQHFCITLYMNVEKPQCKEGKGPKNSKRSTVLRQSWTPLGLCKRPPNGTTSLTCAIFVGKGKKEENRRSETASRAKAVLIGKRCCRCDFPLARVPWDSHSFYAVHFCDVDVGRHQSRISRPRVVFSSKNGKMSSRLLNLI